MLNYLSDVDVMPVVNGFQSLAGTDKLFPILSTKYSFDFSFVGESLRSSDKDNQCLFLVEKTIKKSVKYDNIETGEPCSVNIIIGYLRYYIDKLTQSVEITMLISFDTSLIIVNDIIDEVLNLMNTFHKVTFKAIGGTKVEKFYDKMVQKIDKEKYNVYTSEMHDVLVDDNLSFHNMKIYEIINKNK